MNILSRLNPIPFHVNSKFQNEMEKIKDSDYE